MDSRKLTFEELLSIYENKLAYVRRMIDPCALSFSHTTMEYWEGYNEALIQWFEEMKFWCVDKTYLVRQPTPAEKERHAGSDPLCQIMEYRGETIPIYDDDSGQQFYAKYGDIELSGGSYNPCPEYDWCCQIDYIKDSLKSKGEEK